MINIRKLEAELWESADLLRAGSKLTSNQYCMPVLGLIFLRYAYSRFKMVEAEILKNRPSRGGKVMPVEASDFAAKSALFLPKEAQYDYLLNLPDDISAAGLLNKDGQPMTSFVDLRFPGHEDVAIVDSVPEGWKKEKLINIADVQYGFAFDGSLFNSQGKGTPIIRIRNIPSGTTSDYTTQEADDQYIVSNGDIVVGMDGEFHINSWSGKKAYLVQRTCKFTPKKELMRGWLLQAIYEPIKFFEKTVVGATVAHLGKKHIDTIELLTGPDDLYALFNDLFNKRQLLLNQNILLKEARDRLLPKLMNGEFEV